MLNAALTLQRRFPLKYVNLCQFPHKLYLQLVRKLTQVKPFKPLELSPYSSLTYLFMLTSNIRTYPYYLANLSLTKLAIVVVGLWCGRDQLFTETMMGVMGIYRADFSRGIQLTHQNVAKVTRTWRIGVILVNLCLFSHKLINLCENRHKLTLEG